MFENLKISRVFCHIYVGYKVHDALNKVAVYNT